MLDLEKVRFEGARLTDLEKAALELGQAIANFIRQAVTAQQAPRSDGWNLYSVESLSELLGKSKDTIRRWIANGEFGEPIRVGKSVRITQTGLDKYLSDHSGPMQRRDPPEKSRRSRSPAAADLSDMRL